MKSYFQSTLKNRLTLLKYLPYIFLSIILVVCFYSLTKHSNITIDLDGYDEGVYWQTLKAMSSGQDLYRQIFYSQPPFFIQSIYPIFKLFGQTIFAARLIIVIFSIFSLASIFILSSMITNKYAALLTVILLFSNIIFFKQSLVLQAEIPALSLSLISLTFFYRWWINDKSKQRILLSNLGFIFLFSAILTKIIAIASVLPILTIIGLSLMQKDDKKAITVSKIRSIILGLLLALIIIALLLFPYRNDSHSLIDQVINYHFAAKTNTSFMAGNNYPLLYQFLKDNIILIFLSTLGLIVSIIKKNIFIYPIILLLLSSLVFLILQSPLFSRHLIILLPPLAVLAVSALSPMTNNRLCKIINYIVLIGSLFIILIFVRSHNNYIKNNLKKENSSSQVRKQMIKDINSQVKPNELIISDNQFLISQANRSTPANLVDTSTVRIESNYLTSQELINIAQKPNVRAILFYSNRLNNPKLIDFQKWIKGNFKLYHDYGNNIQLWLKQ
jgi:4-amino-4-deoxy-L-arabinose transferase-like glycosyltransferase